MFVCERTGKTSKPGQQAARVVTAVRQREYPNGTAGWEIVKEELMLPEVAEAWYKSEEFTKLQAFIEAIPRRAPREKERQESRREFQKPRFQPRAKVVDKQPPANNQRPAPVRHGGQMGGQGQGQRAPAANRPARVGGRPAGGKPSAGPHKPRVNRAPGPNGTHRGRGGSSRPKPRTD